MFLRLLSARGGVEVTMLEKHGGSSSTTLGLCVAFCCAFGNRLTANQQRSRWHDLTAQISGHPGGGCSNALGELSGGEPRLLDKVLKSPPHLCACRGFHVSAGVTENAPQRGGDTNVLGELESLLEVGSDRTPRIGADRSSDPPPVLQRPTINSRQNALHAPLFDGIVWGGVDVPKLKSTHRIS